MIYTIVVLGGPLSTQAPYSAYHFARALLAAGHRIHRIFFYQDGVLNGSTLVVAPQDDNLLPSAWQTLQQEHDLDYVVCIGAGIKRGVITAEEAGRYDREGASISPAFDLSGLGQLAEAAIASDRVITFGAGR